MIEVFIDYKIIYCYTGFSDIKYCFIEQVFRMYSFIIFDDLTEEFSV